VLTKHGATSTSPPLHGAAAAKARYALEREWVSLLSDLADGSSGESSAVAISLLHDLREAATRSESRRRQGPEAETDDAADALAAIRRMLSLWEQGLPIPS